MEVHVVNTRINKTLDDSSERGRVGARDYEQPNIKNPLIC